MLEGKKLCLITEAKVVKVVKMEEKTWKYSIAIHLYFSEEAKVSESKDFDFTDEKFLAIAFGSATVLLLILIVIIVVSLVRRGHTR